ncbi:MAG: zinc-dependent metalloprotease [Acidimicrobiia bacterium]|nr:zinc-dependent metalloprotease [Acidimicrobiia bacterium]
MSEAEPPEEFNPFKGMPIFGDLGKLFAQQTSSSWDNARQIAIAVATQGGAESNVEPTQRIALEELARVAELQVSSVTGLTNVRSGKAASIVASTRTTWVSATLEAYRPLLEPIAGASHRSDPLKTPLDDMSDPAEAMIGQIMKMLGPALTSMTAGSMVGNLARRNLGQYDLPIPRDSAEILVIPANIAQLASEWSLDLSDLQLWVCLSELTHHTVLSVPHVGRRMQDLLEDYVASFEADPAALRHKLSDLDLANRDSLDNLESLWGDPEMMLGAIQSSAQRALLPQITALVSVIAGYVDWVVDSVGRNLIGSYQQLSEALRRRRVSTGSADRFIEKMLGLELSQDHYDRGTAFVSGVLERAGGEGLARLWHTPKELPTPAEVEAPGLWLARIDLAD